MASNLYDVYLFDRDDQEVSALSRAKSFDVYYRGNFSFGGYFPVYWKVAKKRSVIYSLIRDREQKRLLRQLTRERRSEIVKLPKSYDYQLFDKDNNRLLDHQFYRAKYLRILKYNASTRRWRKFEDWVFPSGITVVEKKRILKDILEKSSTMIDIQEEYTVRRFFNEYVTRDGSQRTSSHRVITYDKPQLLKTVDGRFTKLSFKKIRRMMEKQWDKEWPLTRGTLREFNLRAKLILVGADGKKREQWVNTSRIPVRKKEHFWPYVWNRFLIRLGEMYQKYLMNQARLITALKSIDIENLHSIN
jgi:hypothetical protein